MKHRGIVPFIDRECLDNLDDLADHVQRSRVLFLFLTNHIFSSPWCMMEVRCGERSEPQAPSPKPQAKAPSPPLILPGLNSRTFICFPWN
jgi:hypothetical protein